MSDYTKTTFTGLPTFPDRETYDRWAQIGRDNWQLTMSPEELCSHVIKTADYHRAREDWWHKESELVKEKIGADGLQIREQQITGGVRHDVVLDPTLSARLSECESKERSHRGAAETMETWIAVLNTLHEPLLLTAADLRFYEVGAHG